MAEQVDLNVVCKNCGAEVSPYITECPYCGQRLRKRAPKLRPEGEDAALAPARRRRIRRRRRPREERALAWLSGERPYGTLAIVVASVGVYIAYRTGSVGLYGLGTIAGPLEGDWWRLATAQLTYENVGYLFAVGLAVAIFGTSIERRYGMPAVLLLFFGCGAVGMYLATVTADFPLALGGNAGALGLLTAWLVRDLRDRRTGYDTESDLLGVAAIALVLGLMPLLELSADAWAGLGGAVSGCVAGLLLPQRN